MLCNAPLDALSSPVTRNMRSPRIRAKKKMIYIFVAITGPVLKYDTERGIYVHVFTARPIPPGMTVIATPARLAFNPEQYPFNPNATPFVPKTNDQPLVQKVVTVPQSQKENPDDKVLVMPDLLLKLTSLRADD